MRSISNGNEYDDWATMNFTHSHLTILFYVLLSPFAIVNGQQSVDWLTGTQLNRQARETAISLDWQNAPLRQRLSELTARQRISVFLDRRIDGSQEIQFSAVNVSFEELLWRLCDHLGTGMCRIDEVYYIGPRETAAALPSQLERIKSTISVSPNRSLQRRWQRTSSLTLAELTEPKLALDGFCRSVNCTVTNLETVPHDLWARTQLGKTSLTGRISLILAGFNKSFELSEDLNQLQISELAVPERINREWIVGDKAKSHREALSKTFPELSVTGEKRSVAVTGTVDEVLAAHRKLVSFQKPKVAELSDQTFEVKMAESRLNILKAISKQIARQLVHQPDHLAQLNTRVEIEMKQATINRLIDKALEGTGLTYRLTDESLEIVDR